MSGTPIESESKVSGNQANIPASIRKRLDIEDGDHLRWRLEDDGTVRVDVIHETRGTFADFEGYDGDERTDAREEHDEWGL